MHAFLYVPDVKRQKSERRCGCHTEKAGGKKKGGGGWKGGVAC